MTSVREIGETLVGLGGGLAPAIVVNVFGLDKTLSIIPDAASVTLAMILIGTTVGIGVGQHMKSVVKHSRVQIWSITISGSVSVGSWLLNYLVVTTTILNEDASSWPIYLSAILTALLFTSWCTLGTIAGVMTFGSTGRTRE